MSLRLFVTSRWARLAAVLPIMLVGCSASPAQTAVSQFTGRDAALEKAINADDGDAVAAALAAGAAVNARGAHGVTPLEYAIGTFRKRAASALIAYHADPNLRDQQGDSAVSLAVNAYARDPELLKMVLDAGGDPNAKRPDGDPVMLRFLSDHNLDAITYLHSRGANIDAYVDGAPMVVDAAWAVDWDVVWHLIELGARTDTPDAAEGLVTTFKVPGATLPDGPLYPYKVKVWRHLRAQGLDPEPPAGMTR